MAFTIGSGTFTNGSATVTGVTLTSGTLAYFASGTRMVVGFNPVIQEVEAIAAPTVTTITLRSAWTGTGGTYSFLANQTSEGLRDAVQAIRSNNASLQSFIDSIDTAATADSVAQRTSNGSLNAVDVFATGIAQIGSSTDRVNLTAGSMVFRKDNTNRIFIGNTSNALGSGDGCIFYQYTAAPFIFYHGDAERMRIDSSGNVGIGVSPLSWRTAVSTKALQISAGSALFGQAAGGQYFTNLSSNIFQNTSNVNAYMNDGAASVYTQADGAHIWSTAPSGTALATATLNERMRITSSGNVGIGTSSPTSKLDISGGAAITTVRIRQTSTSGASEIRFGDNASTDGALIIKGGSAYSAYGGAHSFNIWNNQNGAIAFATNDTERMRIDSSGKVGIGVTNPFTSLDVSNTFRVSGFTDNVVTFLNNVAASSTLVTLRCQNGGGGGTTSFLVRANGNVENTNNSYGGISDAKLKENIEPATPKLHKLMQVEIVNYNMIGDEQKQIGVTAQQLEQVFPSLVSESDDFEKVQVPQLDEDGEPVLDEEGNPVLIEESQLTGTKTKSVKYSVFVPILIKAMQEQQAIIDDLKARIEALEG